MRKNIKIRFFFVFTIIISLLFPQSASASYFSPSCDIYSSAVYLYNFDTDQIVYSKNENEKMQPASLTKIMTALLVLEHFKDNPEAMKTTFVSAPSAAFDELYLTGASTADFYINEEASYSDLLYGLLLQSACEAANIIAYNLGNGSMSDFVVMMNEKAVELGAVNTNFTNAHGLYDENQYTTAKDMAIILKYTYENFPEFSEITSTYDYYLKPTNKHSEERLMISTNKMLLSSSEYSYPYITSGKTGTLYRDKNTGSTDIQNLATTATKDNVSYLLVTLGAPIYDSDGNKRLYNQIDQKNIYEWAFNTLSYTKIVDGKSEICDISVDYGKNADSVNLVTNQDISLFWPSNVNTENKEIVTYVEDSIIAPVNKGDKLGVMELKINGNVVATCDLYASSSVERDAVKYHVSVAKLFPKSKMFKRAILIWSAIVLLYTVLYFIIIAKKSKKRRRRIPKHTSYRR